jgi:hypothetical protein
MEGEWPSLALQSGGTGEGSASPRNHAVADGSMFSGRLRTYVR